VSQRAGSRSGKPQRPFSGQRCVHPWPAERLRLGRVIAGCKDWTDGRIAVTNAEMDEIWQAVADGTAIEIKP
jgi:hypothetical protein